MKNLKIKSILIKKNMMKKYRRNKKIIKKNQRIN